MKYEYNGNLLFEDRINAVAKDIRSAYPEIPYEVAKYIASMESPITTEVTEEMKFRRIYSILFMIQGMKELSVKLYNELIHTYQLIYGKYETIDLLMEKMIHYMIYGGEFPSLY